MGRTLRSKSPKSARLPATSMGRYFMLALIACLASFQVTSTALADNLIDGGTQVIISQKNQELPANDLVYGQGAQRQILSPQQAQALKGKGLDLSKLDPDASTDIWPGNSTISDAALDNGVALTSGQSATYRGMIQTSTGFFRMNVSPDSAPSTNLTIMLGRTVHTLLLRKELLRRLGYKIPPIKYISSVTVHFQDTLALGNMLKINIPNQTQASSDRWCTVSSGLLKADPKIPCLSSDAIKDVNTVVFQDVIAYDATPTIYNVALGVPIDPNTNNIHPSGGRILRASAVPLGLVNVPESFNQLAWYAATVANDAIDLTVPDAAIFNCSLDDGLWIARKIAKLTRQDFVSIVHAAQLPSPVAALLVEKLIARRNSLITVFALKVPALKFNDAISQGTGLVNGKLMQQDWPGYASRFAWGDPDSPL